MEVNKNKIDKFRGIIRLNIDKEDYELSPTVNDLFDFLVLNKVSEQLVYGVNFITRLFSKAYPNELVMNIENFAVENYLEIIEELMIALEWTTRKQIEDRKKPKEAKEPKKITDKDNIMLIKARLAAEVDSDNIEDKYITACYVLMREFKYTRDEVLEMPATVFLLLLDEMNKQYEREKEEMDKNKVRRRR